MLIGCGLRAASWLAPVKSPRRSRSVDRLDSCAAKRPLAKPIDGSSRRRCCETTPPHLIFKSDADESVMKLLHNWELAR
jgi:hypothetical protein